jgi:hypothetical protein
MKGFDYLNLRTVNLSVAPKKKWYNFVEEFVDTFFDRITPLKNEVKVIKGSQNKAIQAIFNFMREMITISMLQAFIFAPYIYKNYALGLMVSLYLAIFYIQG